MLRERMKNDKGYQTHKRLKLEQQERPQAQGPATVSTMPLLAEGATANSKTALSTSRTHDDGPTQTSHYVGKATVSSANGPSPTIRTKATTIKVPESLRVSDRKAPGSSTEKHISSAAAAKPLEQVLPSNNPPSSGRTSASTQKPVRPSSVPIVSRLESTASYPGQRTKRPDTTKTFALVQGAAAPGRDRDAGAWVEVLHIAGNISRYTRNALPMLVRWLLWFFMGNWVSQFLIATLASIIIVTFIMGVFINTVTNSAVTIAFHGCQALPSTPFWAVDCHAVFSGIAATQRINATRTAEQDHGPPNALDVLGHSRYNDTSVLGLVDLRIPALIDVVDMDDVKGDSNPAVIRQCLTEVGTYTTSYMRVLQAAQSGLVMLRSHIDTFPVQEASVWTKAVAFMHIGWLFPPPKSPKQRAIRLVREMEILLQAARKDRSNLQQAIEVPRAARSKLREFKKSVCRRKADIVADVSDKADGMAGFRGKVRSLRRNLDKKQKQGASSKQTRELTIFLESEKQLRSEWVRMNQRLGRLNLACEALDMFLEKASKLANWVENEEHQNLEVLHSVKYEVGDIMSSWDVWTKQESLSKVDTLLKKDISKYISYLGKTLDRAS